MDGEPSSWPLGVQDFLEAGAVAVQQAANPSCLLIPNVLSDPRDDVSSHQLVSSGLFDFYKEPTTDLLFPPASDFWGAVQSLGGEFGVPLAPSGPSPSAGITQSTQLTSRDQYRFIQTENEVGGAQAAGFNSVAVSQPRAPSLSPPLLADSSSSSQGQKFLSAGSWEGDSRTPPVSKPKGTSGSPRLTRRKLALPLSNVSKQTIRRVILEKAKEVHRQPSIQRDSRGGWTYDCSELQRYLTSNEEARIANSYREYQVVKARESNKKRKNDQKGPRVYRCTGDRRRGEDCDWSDNVKGNWKRHMMAHWPQEIWVCHHSGCQSKSPRLRVSLRKDLLQKHHRDHHKRSPGAPDLTGSQLDECRIEVPGSQFPRKCDFPDCQVTFTTFDQRLNHLARHFCPDDKKDTTAGSVCETSSNDSRSLPKKRTFDMSRSGLAKGVVLGCDAAIAQDQATGRALPTKRARERGSVAEKSSADEPCEQSVFVGRQASRGLVAAILGKVPYTSTLQVSAHLPEPDIKLLRIVRYLHLNLTALTIYESPGNPRAMPPLQTISV